jgi:amino acid adenylation domain-containing protein
MSLNELIDELIRLDIHINAEGGQLKVLGDKVTPDIIEQIRANKAALLEHLQDAEANSFLVASIPMLGKQDNYVLSSAQIRLWILSKFEGGNVAYNMPGAYLLEGELNKAALEYAFNALIERHENLRTTFKEDDNGDVKQFVNTLADIGFHIESTDLRQANEQQEQLHELLQWNNTLPFDLATGPLVRAHLCQLSDSRWVFSCVMHHIISDGWSVDILFKELFLFYQAYIDGKGEPAIMLGTLQPLRIQYKDYAVWQQQQIGSDSFNAHRAYWLQQFEGELPVLDFPGDYPRPAIKTYNGAAVTKQLPSNLVQSLKNSCQQQGGTLFMGLVAAVNAVLYRYTGQEDIVLGTPIAGREHADLQNQIGFYANTIGLRTRFSGREGFAALFGKVKEVALGAFKHQAYPFDELIEDLPMHRDTSRSPLFDVVVLLLDNEGPAGAAQQRVGQLAISGYTSGDHTVSKFDMVLAFGEVGDALHLNIEYNTDIYSAATIEQLAAHLQQLLEQALQHTDTPIAQLDYLTESEKHYLVAGINNTDSVYDRNTNLVDLIEAQAAATPGNIAVECGDRAITYQALNEAANRVAHWLRQEHGAKADKLIGIQLERTEHLVATMLGVLKSGAAYVPIDPAYPQERIDYLINDSRCELLIDETTLQAYLEKAATYSAENPIKTSHPNDLAYIIYTSGSTGQPKGVMIEHGNVTAFLHWCKKEFDQADYEVMFAGTSICFDVSIFELFYTLTTGKPLRLLPDALAIPAYLGSYKKILLNTVPSVVGTLIRDKVDFSNVTVLNMAGEAIPEEYVAHFDCEKLPLRNFYGPSEDTTYSTIYHLKNNSPVLIGRPIDNTQVYVVDPHGQLCPVGVIGEWWIAGDGVSRGYLHRPELTAEKYSDNPFGPGRLYKTGDLGRWQRDGNLSLTGRGDTQVKVRGYRIELAEVELALQKHPLVELAAVVVKSNREGERDMVAYVVGREGLTTDTLRDHLGNLLPSYMLPTYFVQLDSMPQTLNGKIDRKQLPDLAESGLDMGSGVEYVEPRNSTEEMLVGLWKEVLDRKRVSVKDNFFAIGGHSLKATRLASHIHKVFDVKLGLRELFAYTVLEEQAKVIGQAVKDKYNETETLTEHDLDYHQASAAQRRLWVLCHLQQDSLAYNVPIAVELNGVLDKQALEKALAKLVERHEILRTVFRVDGYGEVKQVVLKATDLVVGIGYEDWQGREAALEERLHALFATPFDLAKGPLLRLDVLQIGETKWVLSLVIHHIISDAYSAQLVINKLLYRYDADSKGIDTRLQPLPAQYKDYAKWQERQLKTGGFAEEKAWWLQQMEGELPTLQLLGDYARPVDKTYNGATISQHIDANIVQRLKQAGQQQDITLFMRLLAGVNVLLYRYTGQSDIITGTTVTGREYNDLKNQIGFYDNLLPLRVRFNGQDSYNRLLQAVKEVTLGAYRHHQYPFVELVEALPIKRDINRHPLLDVTVVLEGEEEALTVMQQAGELSIAPYKMTSRTVNRFDLSFSFAHVGEALQLNLQYNTDIFSAGTIERVATHLIRLFDQLGRQQDTPVLQLDYLAEEEKQQLLHQFNPSAIDYPSDQTIVELFEAQVAQTPDKVALIYEATSLTYQQLNEMANRAANYWRSTYNIQRDDVMVVALERSHLTLIAILSVLKAGAAYLPVDPTHPEERVNYMIADSQCRVKVDEAALQKAIADSDSNARQNPTPLAKPSSLAYVMYTSGSTGRPKGVMVEHHSVVRLVKPMRYIPFTGNEVLLSTGAVSFDATTFEYWGTLLNGGTLVMCSMQTLLEPTLLTAAIRKHKVDTIWFTAGWLHQLIDTHPVVFEGIRTVVAGGDRLSPSHIAALMQQYPNLAVYNGYGPTENTTFTCSYAIETVADDIPIGKPIDNTLVWIVDEQQQLVPVGVVGELCVGGEGLARGYRNNPTLTLEKFVPNPFVPGGRMYRTGDMTRWLPDGNIEFRGRKDDQVKIAGYRIELAEIETALQQYDGIETAVVVAKVNAEGEKELVAYLMGGQQLNAADIRAYLSKLLPVYMIPLHFVQLTRMPLSTNGKIDRSKLPNPMGMDIQSGVPYVAPRNETETRLLAIWQKMLGRENIGIKDDFFNLGGYSLKMTRLAALIQKEFNVNLTLAALFGNPTIEGIAAEIAKANQANNELMGVDQMNNGSVSDLFMKLKKLKINIQLVNDRLDVQAPKGVLTAELVGEIKQHKAELISFITTYKTKKDNFSAIEKVEERECYPLSSSQRRMWVVSQFDDASIAYNMPGVYAFEGKMNKAALEYCFDQLIERHENLRTVFKVDASGEAKQYIKKAADAGFVMGYVDVREVPEDDREDHVKEMLEVQATQAFDLAEGPLVRATLYRLEEEKWVFGYVMHHIISDGWSMGILIGELMQLYTAYTEQLPNPLEPLHIQYKDYAVWQQGQLSGEQLKVHKGYWLNQFEGEIPVLDLPGDKARPAIQTYNGGAVYKLIGEEAGKAMKELSQEHGGTLFMGLVAAVDILLYKYTGQTDIVVGSQIAGRVHADLENQIGFYLNTLSLRARFKHTDSFRQLLANVKDVTLGAYEHQVFPFDELVTALDIRRDMSRRPIFDISVVLQNADVNNDDEAKVLGGLTITSFEGLETTTSLYDMAFDFTEVGDEIQTSIVYNSDIYHQATIERVMEHLEQLMLQIAANPDQPICELDFLTAEEKEQQLVTFNNAATPYPSQQTIVELFAAQVAATPDATAVIFEQRKLTYAELDEKSNRLAKYLQQNHQLQPDETVGIMLDRSENVLVAILGVLKSGAAYVPLDPEYPKNRKSFILEDTAVKAFITQTDYIFDIEFYNGPVIALDVQLDSMEAGMPDPITTQPNHLAYIMYTSGSTGVPKGVMVEQRSVVRLVKGANFVGLSASDTVLSLSNFAFDGSTFDIYAALLNGGAVYIPLKDQLLDFGSLAQIIEQHQVTAFFITTALLNSLVDAGFAAFGQLKYVMFGGERVSVPHARKFRAAYPSVNLVHVYGPTENTTFSTYFPVYEVGEQAVTVPIGSPISNSTCYILNANDHRLPLLPLGAVGEICVGGDGLARGYLNQAELTAEKFVDNPFVPGGRLYKTGDHGRWLPNGVIEFTGRRDAQVKIRGHRIELGEIETALQGCPGVEAAVVIIRTNAAAEKEIAAYVVGKEPLNATVLTTQLGASLPAYMIPTLFVQLEALPLNVNGKVDVKALPDPLGAGMDSGVEYIEPRNTTEERLLAIWKEVLDRDRISVKDNFFDLGGHSLKATKLASQIHKEFDVKLELKDLFSKTTLEEQAALIDQGMKTTFVGITPAAPSDGYILSSSQRRLWVLSQFQEGNVAYNMPGVYNFEGELDTEALQYAFDTMVQRHESLRTIFKEDAQGELKQYILPLEEAQTTIQYRDLRQAPNKDELAKELVQEIFVKPFNLATGPLIVGHLLQTDDNKSVFVYCMHHIISDGWSMGILINELFVLYNAKINGQPNPLPPLRIQYKDFAVWQQQQLGGDSLNEHKLYWMDQFKGELPVLDLPADNPRPVLQTFTGAAQNRILNATITNGVQSLVQEQGATAFMGVLTAVKALLHRYTNQEDIIVGSPIAGREHADLHDQIGFYVNTLVLRTQFSGSDSYRQLLANVKDVTMGGYQHQVYPFDELVDNLNLQRDTSRGALFDVMVAMQNNQLEVTGEQKTLGNLNVGMFDGGEFVISKFDITFTFQELGEQMLLSIEYNTDIYQADTIERMGNHLEKLMTMMVIHPDTPINELEMVTENESADLLYHFNDTETPYSMSKTLVECFEEQVAQTPDNVALVFEGQEMTYAQLNARANQLARQLQQCGITKGSYVGIVQYRGMDMVISVMAIVKAGGIYVPFEPDFPRARIQGIAANLGIQVILTHTASSRMIEEIQYAVSSVGHVIYMDEASAARPVEKLDKAATERLWDYIAERATDEVSAGGFVSAYSGDSFSSAEVDEYVQHVKGLVEPYINEQSTVIEIGCGSGLLMYPLAAQCAQYIAIDPSGVTQQKNAARIAADHITNIQLLTGYAHELPDWVKEKADVVLIASTAQFFPGLQYLRQTVAQAIALLKPGGKLIMADLLDLEKKQAFADSLVAYSRNHPEAEGKTKQSVEEELYVSATWFEDLAYTMPGIASISWARRNAGFNNELKYRSDAIITAGENYSANEQPQKQQHTLQALDAQSTERCGFTGSSQDIAYVIYTSGSTGTPKGVYVKHQAVVNLIEWVNRNYEVGPADRVMFVTSLCFDLSVYDMFGVLSNGGSLRVVSSADVRNAERLYEILTTEPITFWNSAPAALNQLVPYMNGPVANQLRLVFLSGDWIPLTLPDKLKATFDMPNKPIAVISLGGATEATVWSNYYNIGQVAPHWASIPYGQPIQNSQYYIFNEKLQVQPAGVIGDLYIAGDCLSEGYINDPVLTNSKYIINPYTGQRMYKTGDLCRWWKNGLMEFIGRKDSQVKIRGYRIELGEIEAVLLNHPGVDTAVVVARAGSDGAKELVSYAVGKQPLNSADLRGFLAKSLPAYMVPTHFVQLDAIPLTSNGKVNLRALPKPEGLEMSSGVAYVAPENETEERLAAIWEEVLGRKAVGRNDRFFDLGGNSLKATRLATHIHKVFEVKMGLRDLFTKVVLHEQAEMIATTQKTAFASIEAIPEQPSYAMSAAQRRLWVLGQLEDGSIAYNMPAAYVFDGSLNKEALVKAFDILVERHESLRTVFRQDATGEIRQFIIPLADSGFAIRHHDLRGSADAEKEAQRITQAEFVKPFDLAEGPLIRAHLIQITDNHWLLVYNLHHIISDGWSTGIVIGELMPLYKAYNSGTTSVEALRQVLPPLRIHYKDYAAWQNIQLGGDKLNDHRLYWLKQFEGELPITELPSDRVRPPVKTFVGATNGLNLDPVLTKAFKDLLQKNGSTLYMGIMALTTTLLYRYTGQEDQVVGSPSAGREHNDLLNQIGFYVNTLALRTRFKGTHSFLDMLETTKQVVLGAFEHQLYPFDELVDNLQLKRDTSRTPLFNIMVMLNNNDAQEAADSEEAIEGLSTGFYNETTHVVSKFDLSISYVELGDMLQAGFEYNTDLYDSSTMDRLLLNLQQLVQSIVAAPEQPIQSLDIIGEAEKQQLLVEFNNTTADYPNEQSVIALFEQQALLTPNKTALVFEDASFTYRQLNELANQAGHYLRTTYNIQPDEVVGIKLHRSQWLIVSILGVLKSGAAYLPIDPNHPAERIKFMLGDSNCKLVIDDDALEQLKPAIEGQPISNPTAVTDANSLAYIMYTSGSTGKPKGVLIENRGVVRLVKPMSYMPYKGNEVLLAAGAISFDATTFEFWSILLNGGTLVMCSQETILDNKLLAETIEQKGVNTMWFTPGWLNQLVDSHITLFEKLQTIKVGGDRLSAAHIQLLKQQYPNLAIVNGYGPTENTAASCCYTIEQVVPNIPIGKPIDNSTAWIVDDNLQLVPIGVIGELLVGGAGLARGYLNNPELTAEKFIDNPFKSGDRVYMTGDLARWLPDGNIEFFGRKDDQVKVGGYRIEPGEIEAVLKQHPEIDDALVVAKANSKGINELVAYVISKTTFSVADMRNYLGLFLPNYMVPAHYVLLEVFPLNGNGKVDKKALPDPEGMEMDSGAEYVAPQNETEERLVAIWEEVLERKPIGTQDNFFDLGGSSIKIVKMVGMVNVAFEKKIPVVTAFKYPNIASFAAFMASDGKTVSVAAETTEQMQESLDIMEETFSLLNPQDGDE